MTTSDSLAAATIELFLRHLMTNKLHKQNDETPSALAEAVQKYTSDMEVQYQRCLKCLDSLADDSETLKTYIREFRTIGGQLTNSAMNNGVIDGDAPEDKNQRILNRSVYLVNIRLINSALNHLQYLIQGKDISVPSIVETPTPGMSGLNPDSEWLYSAAEVAAYTHGLVVRSNVKSKAWRDANNFPYKQSGYKSTVRYSKKEIDEWLSEQGLYKK